jgi:hypothetical protein
MKDELEAMPVSKTGIIKLVDIESDPDLKKRFNEQIPVLYVDDVEICHYKLNQKKLIRYLASE